MRETQDKFFEKLESSEDMEDQMQNLVDFLQAQTGATGVYIGQLRYPEKKLDHEALEDTGLFDEDAPKVVKYTHASKGHEFMIDVVLEAEKGVLTHKVFSEEEGEEAPEAEEDEEGAAKKPANVDILTSFKHCFVPEVVREAKI